MKSASLSIRRACSEDLPQIVIWSRAFHAYSPWSYAGFDESAVQAFALGCIENGAVFLSEDGMCGGLVMPLYFNPAVKIGIEFVWYAPAGGSELRQAFEDWSRDQGAHGVQFSALGDSHLPALTRIYARHGFTPAETAFVKRF